MRNLNSNKARAALRHAIKNHQEAQATLRRATDLHVKSQKLLGDLYAKLSAYDNLDAEISEARANTVRQALERGETPDLNFVPDGFAAKLMSRDNLRDQVSTMLETNKHVEADLANAKGAIAAAEISVEHAAEQVLAKEMGALATDYLAKLNDLRIAAYALNAAALRQVRKGQSDARLDLPSQHYLSVASAYRKISMPPVVSDALSEPIVSSYERRFGFKLRNDVAGAVNAHWQALFSDADAELTIPPAIADAHTASVKEDAA